MKWVKEFEKYYTKLRTSAFIFDGNIHDIFLHESKTLTLFQFVFEKFLKKSEVKILFNFANGITFFDEQTKTIFSQFLVAYGKVHGEEINLNKLNLSDLFILLDRFIKTNIKQRSIALYIEDAELLIPYQTNSELSTEEKKILVLINKWAQDKLLQNNDFCLILSTEVYPQLHQKVISNYALKRIIIQYPDESIRAEFLARFIDKDVDKFAKLSKGLNLKDIEEVLTSKENDEITIESFKEKKIELIKKSNFEFFDFFETTRNLNDFAGSEKVVKRLRDDAILIRGGHKSVVPMGYLICGPIGTGKTFLSECFAGEAGIAVVSLKNFRDKYVGQSEANWERILFTLKNLAPVIVVIDEADAALGNREQEGDSGTSKRIFAQIATTMSDTKNRGDIIWMLLTARPELLPVDLKRQGRAEVHLPIFYPKDKAEKLSFIDKLAKKIGWNLSDNKIDINNLNIDNVMSGADIEGVLISLKRSEFLKGDKLNEEEIQSQFLNFKSSIPKEIVEHQIKSALAEITDTSLL
jgi:SpoVK/Ycf46/Vps4 family AAA+-type ATPase